MTRWAEAVAPREQLVLIARTADDLVAADDPVRTFGALVEQLDWSAWEAHYEGHRGQPPIHPRLMAGTILYGMMSGLRSSRRLEEATRKRVDFMWLLEGRTIDHSTLAGFRTRFGAELKDLNRQLARKLVESAAGSGLLELVLDGTRVRANSARQGARHAAVLEKLISRCAQALNAKLEELAQQDGREAAEQANQALRTEVERLQAKQAKYHRAREAARARDGVKQAIFGPKATPVRVPVTDPEATVLPNKEGGFAPNYTPTVVAESCSGAIISADVVVGGDEASELTLLVADCQEVLGREPQRILADGGFAVGAQLERLEAQGVECYIPTGTDFGASNPANRPDPSQAVGEEDWARLPRKKQQLAASAFIYEAERDQYRCPMGRVLAYRRQGRYHRTGIRYRSYACPGKADCPLAALCVKGKAQQRVLQRDAYQEIRDQVGRRMASEEAREVYQRRAPIIEGIFGVIKQSMGIRQFLLRGLGKVRIEWNWVCSAFNLKKLMARCRSAANYRASHAPQTAVAAAMAEPSLLILIALPAYRACRPRPLYTMRHAA